MEFGVVRASVVLMIFLVPGILLMGASLFLVFGRQDRKTKFLNDDTWTLLGVVGFFFGIVVCVLGIPSALVAIFIFLWNAGMP